ncbi:MAG: hypothetical protein LBP50_00835 [Tannerella sp.]|nr:hypothetical protein [Tannerella sp.]
MAGKYISWRKNIFRDGKNIFYGEKIYFVAEKYILRRKNIFPGHKIYFLAGNFMRQREKTASATNGKGMSQKSLARRL